MGGFLWGTRPKMIESIHSSQVWPMKRAEFVFYRSGALRGACIVPCSQFASREQHVCERVLSVWLLISVHLLLIQLLGLTQRLFHSTQWECGSRKAQETLASNNAKVFYLPTALLHKLARGSLAGFRTWIFTWAISDRKFSAFDPERHDGKVLERILCH